MRHVLVVMLLASTMLAQDKLFCPVCQKRGLKSEIRIGTGYTTAMGTLEWYDSNGVYHYDNPNYTIWEYGCSRGHEFNSRGDITDSTDNRPWWVLPSPEEADSVRGDGMRVVICNDSMYLTLDTLASIPTDSTDYTLPLIWWEKHPVEVTLDSLLRRIEALEKRLDSLKQTCSPLEPKHHHRRITDTVLAIPLGTRIQSTIEKLIEFPNINER